MAVSAREDVALKDGGCESPQAQCPHLAACCCDLWSFRCRGSGFVPSIGIVLRASGDPTGVVSSCGGCTYTCLWGVAVAAWPLRLTGGDDDSPPSMTTKLTEPHRDASLGPGGPGLPQEQRRLMATSAFWYILIKQLFGLVHVLEERVIGKFQH